MKKTAHFASESLDFTRVERCFSKEKDRGIEVKNIHLLTKTYHYWTDWHIANRRLCGEAM